jgi:hypothetical protein
MKPDTIEATGPAIRRSNKPAKTSKPARGPKPLTEAEKQLLVNDEQHIQSHLESFAPAGQALKEIRDKRLYRETHATFEDYCRKRWEMSKTQANRLIAAAQAVDNIASVVPPEIAGHLKESTVRGVTSLNAAQQRRVFEKVLEASPPDQPITGALVSRMAHEVAPKAFAKAKPRATKPGPTDGTNGDLVRRTEIIEEIDGWAKRQGARLATMKPADVLTAVKDIVRNA